jgi:hypothetical protein
MKNTAKSTHTTTVMNMAGLRFMGWEEVFVSGVC